MFTANIENSASTNGIKTALKVLNAIAIANAVSSMRQIVWTRCSVCTPGILAVRVRLRKLDVRDDGQMIGGASCVACTVSANLQHLGAACVDAIQGEQRP